MVLTFYGGDALSIATAAKRLPMVFDTISSTYRLARSFPEARRLLGISSDSVKFQSDARVLLETLCDTALDVGCNLLDAANQIPAPPIPDNVRAMVIQAIKEQTP